MKKVLAMILVLCMVFGLAACGGGGTPANNTANNDAAPANNASNNASNNEEVKLTRGVVNINGYTNEYFNLSFKKPTGWEIYSDETLKKQYGYTDAELGENFQSGVDSHGNMIAYLTIDYSTGSNVICAVSHTPGVSGISDASIAQAMSDSFAKQFASFEIVRNQVITINFMGREMPVVDFAYRNQGKDSHVTQIWLKVGTDYAMVLNFTTTSLDMPMNLLNAFSPLK